MVPLRPVLKQVAVCIHDQDAMLQPRLSLRSGNSKRPIPSGVSFRRLLRNRQLPALQQNDAIRTLGKNSALRTPSPSRMPERFWPACNDIVGSGFIFAALFLRSSACLPTRRSEKQSTQGNSHTHSQFHFILQKVGLVIKACSRSNPSPAAAIDLNLDLIFLTNFIN